MLNLPVYKLPVSGIWYFHTRQAGKQLKISLRTRDKHLATLKAIELVKTMTIKKFEIDLHRGIYKAEAGEDTSSMLKVLETLLKQPQTAINIPSPSKRQGTFEKEVVADGKSKGKQPKMTLIQVVNKLFLLKSNLAAATRISYESTAQEFSQLFKNPDIRTVDISHMTKFQEYLANLGNTARTIDSKIARLRPIFTFAIRQGIYKGVNPAAGLNLMTKKQKNSGGYAIFDMEEITQIFDSEYFKKQKIKDPNYYWGCLLALISGCRSSEITTLEFENIKKLNEIYYLTIRNSKTEAGIREVPITKTFFELGFDKFIEGKTGPIFKYQSRTGKGAGNAIGKKFSRHLDEIKVSRDKLVFHSLRKFCNNFLLKNKVPIEVRSQFIGHEIDSVNVQVYANKLNIDELSEITNPIQDKIFKQIKV